MNVRIQINLIVYYYIFFRLFAWRYMQENLIVCICFCWPALATPINDEYFIWFRRKSSENGINVEDDMSAKYVNGMQTPLYLYENMKDRQAGLMLWNALNLASFILFLSVVEPVFCRWCVQVWMRVCLSVLLSLVSKLFCGRNHSPSLQKLYITI